MNSNEKSLVCIFSDPNHLSLSILENLISNNCFINVVSENVESWEDFTKNITVKNKFNICDYESLQKDISYNYVIFCSSFSNQKSINEEFLRFLKLIKNQGEKTFVILPKEYIGDLSSSPIQISSNIGVIYVGDLLGPRINLDDNRKVCVYLKNIIEKKELVAPVGDVIYPVFVSDIARQIVKWLFAFGPFGKEILLLGPDTSVSTFWQVNTKIMGSIKYVVDQKRTPGSLPRGIEIVRMKCDLIYALEETYRWIYKNPKNLVKSKSQKIIKMPKFKTNGGSGKNIKVITYTLLVLLFTPLITLIVSAGLIYFSFIQFKVGHDNLSTNLLHINKIVSQIGYAQSSVLKYIPILGLAYKETGYLEFTSIKISEIGTNAIPVVRKGSEIAGSVLGDSQYSITNSLDGLNDRLQNVYISLSKWERASIDDKESGSLAAKILLSKINFGNYRNLVLQGITIVDKLPSALGKEGIKSYLVLFQNNMELRPTGGFIGSYGILSFDSGRLSDFTISDVYSADGQLNGHVEPPAAIKEYLGEANWWLRDSNWDPDFPTSAKRAEWFLDKETDQQVEGVISLDLTPIKDFLQTSGPIFLSDYNINITSNNLYEKVQSEVQDNFFPGTHTKASFLTALSRNILNKMGTLSGPQKMNILNIAYKNLEGRHLQIFLHDSDLQNATRSLGWDGSVFTPTCEGNCYSDLVGLVEANVGVNKSNYYIKRDVEVDVNIKENEIVRILTLTLSNSANTSLGPSGRYKVYVRLLVPEDSTNIQATSVYGQSVQVLPLETTISKGRKEVGVIIEVLAGETRKLTYTWTGDCGTSFDQYGFYFRKQAGVEDYPVSIKIRTPLAILGSNPTFTLTKEGSYVYNTTLVKDLFARLSI